MGVCVCRGEWGVMSFFVAYFGYLRLDSVIFGYFRLSSHISRISLNPFFGNATRENHATFAKISFRSPIERALRMT